MARRTVRSVAEELVDTAGTPLSAANGLSRLLFAHAIENPESVPPELIVRAMEALAQLERHAKRATDGDQAEVLRELMRHVAMADGSSE